MKHAVLGIGGVGGLVAGLLAKSGQQVDAIVRPQVLAAQPDHILIHQPTGRILANVRITSVLDRSVDVFWIAVKATQLETALEGISGSEASVGAVVPLLNGIDHVGRLREFFGRRVVPATISVESERVAPGHIIQRSPFVRFAISDLGQSQLQSVMEKLSAFGTEYRFIANEATLMWSKLCLLAPLALTTTSANGQERLWLLTTYNVEQGKVEYVVITHGFTANQIKIQITPDGEKQSKATITYRHSALAPEGNEEVGKLSPDWAAHQRVHWESAINSVLKKELRHD